MINIYPDIATDFTIDVVVKQLLVYPDKATNLAVNGEGETRQWDCQKNSDENGCGAILKFSTVERFPAFDAALLYKMLKGC